MYGYAAYGYALTVGVYNLPVARYNVFQEQFLNSYGLELYMVTYSSTN